MMDSSQHSQTRNKNIRLMLKADALICLVAGLAMGVLAIAGPVGIWLGVADFRQGFGFLQVVNGWADWIAGGSLIIAIGIIVTSKILSIEGGMRLGALTLVGTMVSALAFIVPESFRPPEGTPPIHDISTNTQNPPQFVAIAALRADAPNSMEYGSGGEMTAAKLSAMQIDAYPDITPQYFDDNVDVVFERALDAANNLGWEVVDANQEQGRIEATDTTFWFRFKDDVVILISREGDRTSLNARSLSRVGISDVGKNAARLRGFFALL